MSRRPAFLFLFGLVPLTLSARPAVGQTSPDPSGEPSRVVIAAGGGLLASGTYFTGPGDLALASGDAFAGSLQASVAVHRHFAVVLAGAYAQPEWRLRGVPLVGSLGVPGASLWFGDVALRALTPLGRSPGAPLAFAQAGGGLAHYSLSTTLLNSRIDESASNFTVALGAGLVLPLTSRIGIELLAKDYIASFRSVRDLEPLGIEGRRAHTFALLLSGRAGL